MVKTSEITSQNKRHELENLYFNVIQNDDALDESDSSVYSTPKIMRNIIMTIMTKDMPEADRVIR